MKFARKKKLIIRVVYDKLTEKLYNYLYIEPIAKSMTTTNPSIPWEVYCLQFLVKQQARN